MTRHIYIILLLFLTACGTSSSDNNKDEIKLSKVDTAVGLTTNVLIDNSVIEDTTDYDNATYFVVVADTGSDYYLLHKKNV